MLKMNWRKVLETGLSVGQLFLPRAVSDAIDEIEDQVSTLVRDGRSGWSGPEKQQAALAALLQSVAVAEGVSGRDLLHDAQVLAAGRQAINSALAAKVALAQFTETLRAFRASRVSDDSTERR